MGVRLYAFICITNRLWTAVAQVCTVFLCCTGGCRVIFFVVSVISPLHLFRKLPSVVCSLLLCWLHGYNSSDEIFPGHAVSMPSASLSMLLCWVSALVRLLPANDIGWSTAFSGASFLENHILTLAFKRLALRPQTNTSLSMYSWSFSL